MASIGPLQSIAFSGASQRKVCWAALIAVCMSWGQDYGERVLHSILKMRLTCPGQCGSVGCCSMHQEVSSSLIPVQDTCLDCSSISCRECTEVADRCFSHMDGSLPFLSEKKQYRHFFLNVAYSVHTSETISFPYFHPKMV